MQKFIWLDLETSSLSPESGSILEIAAVATNNKLNELGRYGAVLHFKANELDLSKEVWKMYTDNGLFDECATSVLDKVQVQKELLEWTKNLNLGEKPMLCGNTVHFDKNFLRVKMPDFHDTLHHRIIDVSTIKEMLNNFYNFKLAKPDGNHRALADVYASIEEFRKYLSILKIDSMSW